MRPVREDVIKCMRSVACVRQARGLKEMLVAPSDAGG